MHEELPKETTIGRNGVGLINCFLGVEVSVNSGKAVERLFFNIFTEAEICAIFCGFGGSKGNRNTG